MAPTMCNLVLWQRALKLPGSMAAMLRQGARRAFHGIFDGTLEGMFDGIFDGTLEGMLDEIFDGMLDGMFDGMLDGKIEMPREGTRTVLPNTHSGAACAQWRGIVDPDRSIYISLFIDHRRDQQSSFTHSLLMNCRRHQR